MRVNQDENVIVAARHSVPILIVAGKDLGLILIVADGLEDFWSGVGGGTSSPGAAGLSRAPAITFDVHLEDRGVMHEPVDRSERHCRVAERFMMLFSSNVSYIVLALSAPRSVGPSGRPAKAGLW